jgi:large subunit ribosomal protein L4
VVFGPHPRSYGFRVNNKVVKLAMRSALSAKLADESLYVVDGFAFDEPSTKTAKAMIDALGIMGRVTVVVGNEDTNAILSFRNLPQVRVITAGEANTYDLVDNSAVLVSQPVLSWLEGVLS